MAQRAFSVNPDNAMKSFRVGKSTIAAVAFQFYDFKVPVRNAGGTKRKETSILQSGGGVKQYAGVRRQES